MPLLTAADVRHALDQKTKPPGSLGRLEDLAVQLALLQQTLAPHVDRPHVLVFAADHGVAAEGVSAYPPAVTAQMVANYSAGGAAINALARSVGAALDIFDVGVDADAAAWPGVAATRVRRGSRNLVQEDALTAAECAAALEVGRAAVRQAVADGADLLAFGEMGIGNTTAAAALYAHALDLPASIVVGRGTGVDDTGLARKVAAVTRAVARHGRNADPLARLAALGGLEIAALTGALLESHAQRRLVLLDGYIVTAAALTAWQVEPGVADVLVAAHQSAEPGHAAALAALGLRPLLDWGLRLGEGSGAVLAVPLVRAAAAILRDMHTFDHAGVAGPVEARHA